MIRNGKFDLFSFSNLNNPDLIYIWDIVFVNSTASTIM